MQKSGGARSLLKIVEKKSKKNRGIALNAWIFHSRTRQRSVSIRGKVSSNFSVNDDIIGTKKRKKGFGFAECKFKIRPTVDSEKKDFLGSKMPLKSTLTKTPLESDCSFFASTIEGTTIRGILETLRDIVFEGTFKFGPDGIRLVTLDSSKKSLVSLDLRAESFDTYKCDNEIVCGINLSSFTKLLKSVNKNIVTFFIEKSNPYFLGLVIESQERSRLSVFRVPILDIEFEDINIPHIEFDAEIQIASIEFQKLCRELAVVGDIVNLKSDGLNLSMAAKGGALGTEQITEFCVNSESENEEDEEDETDDDDEYEDEDEDGEACRKKRRIEIIDNDFEIKYLLLFAKSASLSPYMKICISNGKPLVLKYQSGCLGNLVFLLSPLQSVS